MQFQQIVIRKRLKQNHHIKLLLKASIHYNNAMQMHLRLYCFGIVIAIVISRDCIMAI